MHTYHRHSRLIPFPVPDILGLIEKLRIVLYSFSLAASVLTICAALGQFEHFVFVQLEEILLGAGHRCNVSSKLFHCEFTLFFLFKT